MTPEQQARFMRMQQLDDTKHKTKREQYQRSPINYTGSKDASCILPHLPYRNGWCDVFGGSGNVTIARRACPLEVYNDRHSGLTAFFIAVQHHLDELIERIKMMPHSRELFIYNKENYEAQQDTVTRAAMFYYVVQSSFGGRCEYFGRTTKGRSSIWRKIHEQLKHFPTLRSRFRTVTIENLDWRQIFEDYDSPDMVFYLDPPYIESNIYKHKMDKADHQELCQRAMELEGFVALSGFDNEIYDAFDWDRKEVMLVDNKMQTRSANSFGGLNIDGLSREEKRVECLWIKE